jgi:hypothetical protein
MKTGFYKFLAYAKEHKVMDANLIKDWQENLGLFQIQCESFATYSVDKFLKEFKVPYAREFRRLMAYLVKEKKVGLKLGRNPVYSFLVKIENKYIQEWYADYRLQLLKSVDKAPSEGNQSKPKKESKKKVKIVLPKTNAITIQYDPDQNFSDIDNDEWGVIQWLKNRGYKVSKLIEKVL